MTKSIQNNLKRKETIVFLSLIGALSLLCSPADNTFAHTTILKKNTPTSFAAREELEGSSSVINSISIPHGCNGTPVQAISVVFPNGEVTATRTDTDQAVAMSDHIVGNAVMSPRPVQDRRIFEKIERKDGTVPGFLSRGRLVTTDTRSFSYTHGELDARLVGVVPWRGSYPRFEANSCATKLHVNIAVANYCTKSATDDDRADVWIGFMTPQFDDPAVVVQSPPGFWPTLAVIRDLDKNPLPAGCGDGFEIAVSPTADDIDENLPIEGYWPAK